MADLADDVFEVTVRSSERVFAGHVWDIRRDTFDYGGQSIVREYVDHTGAVAVLALDDAGRVLLIKQYRHPIGKRDWEIPAGLLDITGEAPLVGAKRELAEEVDLEAATWHLLADFATSPGGSNELLRVYLARDLTPTERPYERSEEEVDIEKRWVDLDDAVSAVLERTVSNAILSLALLAAQAGRATGWTNLGDADAPWPAQPGRRDRD
jgi:8-oxo-dGTP pyrophosphatase MutT (NUDIX family)